MQIFHDTSYNFMRWKWHAIAASWALILIGVGHMVAAGGPRYGIDFSGGTVVYAKFKSSPDIQKVRTALDRGFSDEKIIQPYDLPSKNQAMIRLQQRVTNEQQENLESGSKAIVDALAKYYPENPVVDQNTEIVGPVIGKDLQRRAIYATGMALLGMLLWIGYRFRQHGMMLYGTAATIATLHDVLITIGLLSIFRYDITLNVVAALLTLVGYSTNDTIVVFDRIRENHRSMRRDDLATIINRSINQTLSRTIITSGLTFLAVLSLFIMGGEVLRGFAFTLIAGIIIGTYSSIFVASPILEIWREWSDRRRVTPRSAVAAPAPRPAEATSRPANRTKGKKARAS